MNRPEIPPEVIDRFEDAAQLWGKRTRDIPELAGFRIKFRWWFYRAAEFNLAIAVFQAILAFGPHYPLQALALLGLSVNVGMMIFNESRAASLSRELNRRAAEQLLRDMVKVRD